MNINIDKTNAVSFNHETKIIFSNYYVDAVIIIHIDFVKNQCVFLVQGCSS
jgi:hypothetical protein